jgi:serine/threonine-protein kinase
MPDATTAPTHAGPDPLQRTVINERPPGPPAVRTPGESAQAGRSGSAAKPSDRRRRARRRTAIVVIVILLLGLLTGYGAWWLTVGRYRQVPDVNGLTQSVATQQLVRDGFAVNAAVTKEFSENVKSGQIIRTDPAGSSHVIKGKPVTLVVSRGPERFPVPKVAGGSFTAAQQALATIPGAHIVRSDAADGTGKIPKSTVIRTDPAAGQPAKRGQVITVFVSSGPPVISVPNVTGKSKDEAQQMLTSAGFTANFVDDYSDTVAEGKVIGTSPPANTSAVKFSSVSVVLSKGPAIVTIPDIAAGSDPDEAKVALENLGLVVVVKKKNKAFLDFSSYKVDRVEPGPGTHVHKGSTVILHVK